MDSWISALILTETLERFGVFRAMGAAMIVAGASWLSYRLVGANVSPMAGVAAGWGVPTALLAWALWRPARTRLSADIVFGAFFCLRLLMFLAAFAVAWSLLQAGFHLPAWISRNWREIGTLALLWAAQRFLLVWAVRSERIESARLRDAAARRMAA